MATLTEQQITGRPFRISDFDEEDLLKYPYEDGEPMAESEHQLVAIIYMVAALKTWFAEAPTVYVGGDMFIYYREGYPSRVVAPDAFVVFGAEGTHKRLRWRVWAQPANRRGNYNIRFRLQVIRCQPSGVRGRG